MMMVGGGGDIREGLGVEGTRVGGGGGEEGATSGSIRLWILVRMLNCQAVIFPGLTAVRVLCQIMGLRVQFSSKI